MHNEKGETMEKEKQVKKMNVPHIFIIILCIILLACLATYVATPGVYDMDEPGSAIAGSYHLVEREPVSPWAALLMIKKGIESAASVISLLLVAGGVLYTIGAVLYAKAKKHRYMHSVFHLFVVFGSVLHFFCILFYVL